MKHLFLSLQDDLTRCRSFQAAPIKVADLEEEDPEQFLQGVARIKRYIRDGDVFQVNLARRWRGTA